MVFKCRRNHPLPLQRQTMCWNLLRVLSDCMPFFKRWQYYWFLYRNMVVLLPIIIGKSRIERRGWWGKWLRIRVMPFWRTNYLIGVQCTWNLFDRTIQLLRFTTFVIPDTVQKIQLPQWNKENALMLKLCFYTISNNSYTFQSILIIFREIMNINKAYINT